MSNIVQELINNLSYLSLGTVKFGRNQGVKYPKAFELPTDSDISSLLSLAKDLGVNGLDTAPAYGLSEQRLGKLIQNHDDWIITTKVGEEFENGRSYFDFSKKHVEQSIQRSLKRLNRESLDIVLIHSDGNDLEILNNTPVVETLQLLKDKGDIKSFGISSKTVDGAIKALEVSDWAMVTYNIENQSEKPVIDYAHKNNKGILIKKALGSGYLQPEAALEYILECSGVTSIILGTINPNHLRYNVDIINNFNSSR